MQRIFRFQPHLQPVPADDGGVFLLGEDRHFLLTGRVYRHLCPVIDGCHSEADLIAILADRLSPAEVLFGLETLAGKGYLTCHPSPLPLDQQAFWAGLATDPAPIDLRVAIWNLAGQDPAPLVTALGEAGVAVDQDAHLTLVLTGDYLDPALEDYNRRALARDRPWLPVRPDGISPWLGPVFQPGQGPCWACLAARLEDNRPVEQYLGRQTGEHYPPPRAGHPASRRAALDLAALAALNWLTDHDRPALQRSLVSLEALGLRTAHHPVTRRPQCPACGDPDIVTRRGWQPVVPVSRPRVFTADGGHRCQTPEQTVARLEHHLDPLTGIVTSLGPVPGRHHPLRPVFGANYRVCPRVEPSFDDFHQTSLGKGRTPAQARASALGEALERWSTLYRGDEPMQWASYRQLGEAAVHPRELLNFSDHQYRNREEWNHRVGDRRQAIPLPLDQEAVISWTPVWSLSRQVQRLVPTAYCYNHTPPEAGRQFCPFNPNGHAAGNCLEEALLQALLELVERDGVAIWWYNRIPRPAVELAGFGDDYFLELQDHYRTMGWELWVLDLTTDLAIPVFAALAHQGTQGRWCIGFGCHPDPRLGVQRALTELNQLFDLDRPQAAPWDPEHLGAPDFLLPAGQRRAAELPALADADLLADLDACRTRLEGAGLEVLALEQSRPEVDLTTVAVLVPGLRHFWPRFGPGRLYDVPVRLGWRDRPLSEDRLNPAPLFL